MPGKRYDRQFKLSAARLVLERDPGQGAVRPAQRAVPRPRKAGCGIWGRRRGRVPRKRQPRRKQGLRDTEAQEGERELRKEAAILKKNPGLLEASPSVGLEFARAGEHWMGAKKAYGTLGASRGGYHAFPNRPKSSRQIAREALEPFVGGHPLRRQSQIRTGADRHRASQDQHRRERQDRASHDDEEGAGILQGP